MGKVNRQLKCFLRSELHEEIMKETDKLKNSAAKIDRANTQFKIKRMTTLKRALKKDEEVKKRLAKLRNAKHETIVHKLYEKCLAYARNQMEKRVKENKRAIKKQYERDRNIERRKKYFEAQWKAMKVWSKKCEEKRKKEILEKISENRKEQKTKDQFKKRVDELEHLIKFYAHAEVNYDKCFENSSISDEYFLKCILNLSLTNIIKHQLVSVLQHMRQVAFQCVKTDRQGKVARTQSFDRQIIEQLVQEHAERYVWLRSPPQYFLDHLKDYCNHTGDDFGYNCLNPTQDLCSSICKNSYEIKDSKSNIEEVSIAEGSMNIQSTLSHPASRTETISPHHFFSRPLTYFVPETEKPNIFQTISNRNSGNGNHEDVSHITKADSQLVQDESKHPVRRIDTQYAERFPVQNFVFPGSNSDQCSLLDPNNVSVTSLASNELEKLLIAQRSTDSIRNDLLCSKVRHYENCGSKNVSKTSLSCDKTICKQLCPDQMESLIDMDCSRYIPNIKFETTAEPILSLEIYKELNSTDEETQCGEEKSEQPQLTEKENLEKETAVIKTKRKSKRIRQKSDRPKEREILKIVSELQLPDNTEEVFNPFSILYNSIHFLKTEVINIICKLLSRTKPPEKLELGSLFTELDKPSYFEHELNYLLHDFVIDNQELCKFIEKFCLFIWHTSNVKNIQLRKKHAILNIRKHNQRKLYVHFE